MMKMHMRRIRIVYDISFMGSYGICGTYRVVDGTVKGLVARPDVELILYMNEQINSVGRLQKLLNYINSDSRLERCRWVSELPRPLIKISKCYLNLVKYSDNGTERFDELQKQGLLKFRVLWFFFNKM